MAKDDKVTRYTQVYNDFIECIPNFDDYHISFMLDKLHEEKKDREKIKSQFFKDFNSLIKHLIISPNDEQCHIASNNTRQKKVCTISDNLMDYLNSIPYGTVIMFDEHRYSLCLKKEVNGHGDAVTFVYVKQLPDEPNIIKIE